MGAHRKGLGAICVGLVLTAGVTASACSNASGGATKIHQQAQPTPSPTTTRLSRAEFLIGAGNACLSLLTARDAYHDLTIAKSKKETVIALRTLESVGS